MRLDTFKHRELWVSRSPLLTLPLVVNQSPRDLVCSDSALPDARSSLSSVEQGLWAAALQGNRFQMTGSCPLYFYMLMYWDKCHLNIYNNYGQYIEKNFF